MGDRISISFSKTEVLANSSERHTWESGVLFSHWSGRHFIDLALNFVEVLQDEKKKLEHNISDPLFRFEPDRIMFNFIRFIPIPQSDYGNITLEYKNVDRLDIGIQTLTKLPDKVILATSDYYLPKDEYSGDNSDNGHFRIDVTGCEDLKTKPKVLQGNEVVRVLA